VANRVGVRIGHAITRRALGKFNLDTSRGHMAISSSALTAIDAMPKWVPHRRPFCPKATDMTVRVDTQPMTVFTAPPGRLVRGPVL